MMFRFHPRANAAVIAGPILLVIVGMYAASTPVSGHLDGYWDDASAQAVSALLFIAPITAACSAWEAGRFRRAAAASWTPSRGAWQVATAALLPVLVLAILALATALLSVRLQMGAAPGWPDARILGSAVAVVTAHIAVGYAIGLLLPAVAAVPVVLVGDYLWNVYPPALEPLWLRHLTTPVQGCCDNVYAPDPSAIGAPALLALGLAALAVSVAAAAHHMPRLHRRPDKARYSALAGALVVLVGTVAGSVGLVHHLGADAVRPRPLSQLSCARQGDGPKVCLWPEHSSRLSAATRDLTQAARQLTGAGLARPTIITEADQQPTEHRWLITVRRDSTFTERDLMAGLASNLAQNLPRTSSAHTPYECPKDPEVAVRQAEAALNELNVWLAVHAGVAPAAAAHLYSPQAWTAVSAVLTTPLPAQTQWYRTALAKARCLQ